MTDWLNDDDQNDDDSGLVRDLHKQLQAEKAEKARLRDELAALQGPARPSTAEEIRSVDAEIRSAHTRSDLEEALKKAGFTTERPAR